MSFVLFRLFHASRHFWARERVARSISDIFATSPPGVHFVSNCHAVTAASWRGPSKGSPPQARRPSTMILHGHNVAARRSREGQGTAAAKSRQRHFLADSDHWPRRAHRSLAKWGADVTAQSGELMQRLDHMSHRQAPMPYWSFQILGGLATGAARSFSGWRDYLIRGGLRLRGGATLAFGKLLAYSRSESTSTSVRPSDFTARILPAPISS
jgi:hypothetical protein